MLRSAVLGVSASVALATYTPKAALTQLHLAGAAYCDQASVTTWSCGAACSGVPGVTHVTAFYNNSADNGLADVYGYVAKLVDGSAVLSFRGTEGIRDWILDFDLTSVTLPNCTGCKLHEGFYMAWVALRGQALDALDKMGAKTGPGVYVTGHSLGAAMANVAAYDLATLGYPLAHPLINFGQPRTGDPAYAAAYAALVTNRTAAGVGDGTSSYRVVHAADPVPQLPPQLLGYAHSPVEVWYNEASTSYTLCEEASGEDPQCSDSRVDLDFADHTVYLGVHISELCG